MSHQYATGGGKSLMQKSREDTDVLNAKGFRGTWKTTVANAVQEWMVMKMRLIDADAVLEELKRMEVEMMPAKLAHIYTAVVVENAPTIDAVPVVRCKDCKWWTKQEESIQGRCALAGIYPTGGWYCGNGKREDNE